MKLAVNFGVYGIIIGIRISQDLVRNRVCAPAMQFLRWSLFHSCQCSVPSAEYSDGLEDDAMHCA